MSRYLLLIILCTFSLTAQEKSELPSRYQDMVKKLDAFIQEKIDNKQIVGVTVAFEDGDVFWSKGYGYADIENNVPATEASSYRMASVSKPFTAVGILELVEQGKVDLDAEIQAYLPDFPRKKWPLTSRQLLGHLGGVSHYRNYSEEAHTFEDMTTEEALAIFQDWELLAEPGTEYNYTTYGYNVLWAIIESVSGQSYQDFMIENVWKPLGMKNTTVDYLYKLIPNRVGAYRLVNGEIENTTPVSTSLKIGGGGTRSTAGDMIRFASGLNSGKVLNEKTRKEMWQPMTMKNGRNITYGMGWGVGDIGGRYVVQHSGGQEGTRTHLVHLPGNDITISAACNFENASPQQITRFIARMLLDLRSSGSNPYFSNDSDKQLYTALDHIYDQGLSFYDWNGKASTSKRAEIDAAFALLNNSSLSAEAIDAAAHPVGGMKWRTLGSYMAQQIARINSNGISKLYGEGQLEFLSAYINAVQGRSDVPKAHYLSAGLTKKLTSWQQSWKAISETEMLSVNAETEPEAFKKEFQKRYAESALMPDYTQEIWQASQAAYVKEPAKAKAFTKVAYDLYPESALSIGSYGVMSLLSGDEKSGLELLKKSAAADPNGIANQDALNTMAYRIGGLKQYDNSIRIISAAIEMNPDVANLRDSLGEFYLEKGEKAKAIASYQKALEIDPNFQNAKDMLKKIEAMP